MWFIFQAYYKLFILFLVGFFVTNYSRFEVIHYRTFEEQDRTVLYKDLMDLCYDALYFAGSNVLEVTRLGIFVLKHAKNLIAQRLV